TTTRAATVLQLLTYARMLERLQGVPGEYVHVVAPGVAPDPFARTSLRVEDYDAVTGRATRRFEAFAGAAVAGEARTVPEPVDHCAVCGWWASCRARWRDQDHLSLVANLGGARRAELERHGVDTRRALAERRHGIGFKPEYGRTEAYLSAAHQAEVQVRSEDAAALQVDRLPLTADEGLARLPRRSEADVYVDLEGTPFFAGGGLEYLWGWSIGDGPVTHLWAFDRASERRAFERFIDTVGEHLARHPDAHVVHFGPYEVSAFKRLMGRHATREEELDALLRREAFVDLLPVVRQGFRVGVEAYSLKDLERLHGYVRDEDLRTLGPLKREVEHATVLGTPDAARDVARDAVARYNADDVLSTVALHSWLEAEREAQGVAPKALPDTEGEPNETLSEARQRVQDLVEALMADVPEDPAEHDDDTRAKVLLAHLLDFERREAKVAFWELYAHRDMTPEQLEESSKGIVGLRYLDTLPPQGRQRTPRVRYAFPPQDLDVRSNDAFRAWVDGTLRSFAFDLDLDARTLVLTQGRGAEAARVEEGFFWNFVDAPTITEARLDVARDVVERGLEAPGRYRAARDLLLARVGRTASGFDASQLDGEGPLAAAERLAFALDGGVLPVQGPPGAGKSYTAARTILALVAAGQRVAVTALSHKAIGNLLEKVVEAAEESGVAVRVGQQVGKDREPAAGVKVFPKAADVKAALDGGAVEVVGGTAWA
ncbi:MAG: TM0106 family RecB-like putative nuclease, partial [Trueperaceae bacterium]|nr:TM0106 family RecB-like putative nuclease [Trueperaceae bacterium]